MSRPLCRACQKRPCAVNYRRDDVTHYRTRCDYCIKKSRGIPVPKPRWQQGDYKKKQRCDLCGFRSRTPSQILVYHIDGNLNHNHPTNLRSVCRNCAEVVQKDQFTWRRGDLEPDF